MWYFYDLNVILNDNEMKNFTEDFEKVMNNLFDEKINGINVLDNYLIELKGTMLEEYLIELKREYIILDLKAKKKLKKIFRNNYQIKRVLKKEIKLYSYSDIEKYCGKKIKEIIKKISKYLYEEMKKIKAFKDKYIGPLEYYQKLKDKQIVKKTCPFCGKKIVESGKQGTRETYDHYIPKGTYPFISLHYYNLIPMCYDCNSNFKGQEDIYMYSKVFDPFEIKSGENKLVIKKIQNSKNNNNIKKIKIKNNLGKTNEIYAWNNIFKVKERSREVLNDLYEEVIDTIQKIIEENEISDINELKKHLKSIVKIKNKHRFVGTNLFYESLYQYFLENYFEYEKSLNKID